MLPLERVARTKLLVDPMPASRLPKPYTLPFRRAPVAQPIGRTQNTDLYSMDMKESYAEILPGYRTRIWGYDGVTPGPTIEVQQGRRIAIRHCNLFPARHPVEGYKVQTSVHLHGSASLPEYDGYASDTTAVDHDKDYHDPNFQDARTLWYRDHGVHHTANNAYMGLAGMYILHSPEERALRLPRGDHDVPLVIRDAMFDKKGQLLYDDNSHSGVYGDVTLVNGVPWPIMDVEAPQVPLPDPQRLAVALLPLEARRRRADDRRRRRRRPHEGAQLHLRAVGRRVGHQRPDLEGRRRQRLQEGRRQPDARRHGDVAVREQERRVVPPRPRPPRRLQDP